MVATPDPACFVIADISGYTSFLAGVELDHAHDIIADIMNTVLKRLRPPFRLAKFEGDAAFVYALGDKIDGSVVQDAIEAAYFAFRRRLRDIRQATTCTCRACKGMDSLDLKFVAHHGEFIKHRMAGREEITGRDVILVHRLLKNAVNERLGGHAYALYSDACMQAAGSDPAASGLAAHRETIDVIGEVTCWVRDLEAAWREDNDRTRNEVAAKGAALVVTLDIPAPRPLVWEYFTVPGQRPKWRAADEVREATQGGRRGVGTTNHCMHGAAAIIEEVLDWRPFDYLTLTTLLPVPGAPKILMTYAFFETDGDGTRVEIRVAPPKPKDRAFVEQAGARFREHISHEAADLAKLLAEKRREPAAVEEPAAPVSAERFLHAAP